MDQVNMALEPVRAFLIQLGGFLPKLFLAIIILVVGWILAKSLRFIVGKMLRTVNFNVLTERAGIDGFMQQGGIKIDTIGVFSLLAYWFVILSALMIAFNSLGLTYVTDLIGRVVLFAPNVVVAILILAFGSYFARFVSTSIVAYCKNVGVSEGDLFGRIAMWAIMVFVIMIALDQVHIGGDIIRHSFLILLAGVVLTLAIAFGLGGQRWAAEQLARVWRLENKSENNGK